MMFDHYQQRDLLACVDLLNRMLIYNNNSGIVLGEEKHVKFSWQISIYSNIFFFILPGFISYVSFCTLKYTH